MEKSYEVLIKWPDGRTELRAANIRDFMQAASMANRLLRSYCGQKCTILIGMKNVEIDTQNASTKIFQPTSRVKKAMRDAKNKIQLLAKKPELRIVKDEKR